MASRSREGISVPIPRVDIERVRYRTDPRPIRGCWHVLDPCLFARSSASRATSAVTAGGLKLKDSRPDQGERGGGLCGPFECRELLVPALGIDPRPGGYQPFNRL